MILACRGRPSVYVCTAIIDCQYRSCHPGAGDVVNLRDRNTLIYRSRCRTWRGGRFHSRHCRWFHSRHCRWFLGWLCRRFGGRRCRRLGGRLGTLHRFCHSRRGGLRCVKGIVRCRLCRLCSHPRICCLVWYTCRHRRRLHTLCRCCRWVRALHRCIRYHISRIRLFCLLRLIAVLRLRCRLSRLDCHRTFVGLFLILGGHDSLAGLFAGYDSLCIHCGDLFMFGFPDHLSPGTL